MAGAASNSRQVDADVEAGVSERWCCTEKNTLLIDGPTLSEEINLDVIAVRLCLPKGLQHQLLRSAPRTMPLGARVRSFAIRGGRLWGEQAGNRRAHRGAYVEAKQRNNH